MPSIDGYAHLSNRYVSTPATKLEFLRVFIGCRIVYSPWFSAKAQKLHTRVERSKGQNGYRRHGHGKEATALEPLHLWTSSTGELFFIEQRLSAAIVQHIGQSWVEATALYKLPRGKIDPHQRLSSTVVSSTGHLEIYKHKLVDARGPSHHWNKMQSWAHWDDWVSGVTVRQTDRRTDSISSLYSR